MNFFVKKLKLIQGGKICYIFWVFCVFQATPYFFAFIAMELLLSVIKQDKRYRLSDAVTSISAGVFSRLPVFVYHHHYKSSLAFRLKEGNVLFNDALNTFYLRLYGVGDNTFK